jgi:hypothetical protein
MFPLALHLCGRPPSLVSVYMSLSSCVLSYYTNALSLSNIYVTQAFIKKKTNWIFPCVCPPPLYLLHIMKLSSYIEQIEWAYQSLICDATIAQGRHSYAFDYTPRRPSHIIPRERAYPRPPWLAPNYNPDASEISFSSKERLVLLAAFEASFQDTVTPLTPNMVPIIIDSGTSVSISPYATDFIGDIQPVQNVTLKGIAHGLRVAGIGTIQYKFLNDDGKEQTLTLRRCLHVPQCSVRLLCPQQIGAMTGCFGNGFNATHTRPTLTVHGKPTTLAYDTTSNLPLLFTAPGITTFERFHAKLSKLQTPPSPPSTDMLNLTKLQRRKLYLHECCAHKGFENLNRWIREGKFPGVDPSLTAVEDPQCITCNFGKARRKSHKSNIGHISAAHKHPSDGVSSDGMEAGTPGRPFTTKGQPSTMRFKYASFWIDHASSLVYATFHPTKAATELLKSKAKFEEWASRYNVSIKSIRADNGVNAAQAFKDSCTKHRQKLTFCGVGAHWQNGIAERFIGTITKRARTILLHAMHRWPSVIHEDLWPFAVRHAIAFHNASIRKGKTDCPFQAFTGEDLPDGVQDFRVFRSPVYVLKKELQDGNKLSKWTSRSWQGVYIGHLNCHLGSIPLIYNPTSTHISPQYHVIFDEFFQTVTDTPGKTLDDHLDTLFGTTANWSYKDAFSNDPYTFDTYWSDVHHPDLLPPTGRKRRRPAPSYRQHLSVTREPSRVSFRTSLATTSRGSTVDSTLEPQGTPLLNAQEKPSHLSTAHFSDHTIDPGIAQPDAHGASQGTAFHRADSVASIGTALYDAHEAAMHDAHEAAVHDTQEATPERRMPRRALPSAMRASPVTDSRGSTPPVIFPADLPAALQSFYESQGITASSDPGQPLSTSHASSPWRRQHNVTYMAKRIEDSFTSYKRRRLIDDSIYILTSSCEHLPLPSVDPTVLADSHPIFQASTDLNLGPRPSVLPPYAYAAVDNKADTLTQSQMLKDPDRAKFVASQQSEINGVLKMDVFKVLPMNTNPPAARLLSSIWSYRRKRSPVGTILKHKSRLCVAGSQQLFGRDFWETYAPVVSWSTVHLLLLLSTILGLETRHVDYTQAFPQAPLDDPVYMRMSQGWHVDASRNLAPHPDPTYNDTAHYIRLKRNLYGCCQADRNWFAHLTKGLLANGFRQSVHDPCLYLRSDCIMIVYTDDCLIFAREHSTIDTLIKSLASTYALEDQGTVNDYLGIRIVKNQETKEIVMTQPGLIESILQDLNLLHPNTHTKDTPAMGILHPDRQGHPREDTWNYCSLIGKLNYLAQKTCPDISFAVHQCARFSNSTTALHKLAVKRIGRYLLLTKDKGLIMSPHPDFQLDVYVDADFAGLWHRDHAELRECALSRTGFIITYCGCPIH